MTVVPAPRMVDLSGRVDLHQRLYGTGVDDVLSGGSAL